MRSLFVPRRGAGPTHPPPQVAALSPAVRVSCASLVKFPPQARLLTSPTDSACKSASRASSASASARPTDPAARAIILAAVFKNLAAAEREARGRGELGKGRWRSRNLGGYEWITQG